jgi:hypothetical protein
MKAANYCVVSGIFFALVCLAHALRIVGDYPVQVDEYAVPMSASWIAAVVTACLAYWAFRVARISGEIHD